MRVGLVQMTSGIDPAANAQAIGTALTGLAGEGAKIAFTPEMSGLLDRDRARLMARAVGEADDPTLAAARAVAASLGLWVALGSLALRAAPGDERLVNRSFLIDSTGTVAARYDKIHLFDADVGATERYRESATFAAGDKAVLASTPWGPLALSICYDLRFAGLYAALARAGAELIAIPAAFTVPTGRAHWLTLVRARAIEAGAFVIAAAQTGHHEDERETFGHSLVVDPWGEVLLDMGDQPGTAVVDIDPGAVAAARSRVPTLTHARAFEVVRAGE